MITIPVTIDNQDLIIVSDKDFKNISTIFNPSVSSWIEDIDTQTFYRFQIVLFSDEKVTVSFNVDRVVEDEDGLVNIYYDVTCIRSVITIDNTVPSTTKMDVIQASFEANVGDGHQTVRLRFKMVDFSEERLGPTKHSRGTISIPKRVS